MSQNGSKNENIITNINGENLKRKSDNKFTDNTKQKTKPKTSNLKLRESLEEKAKIEKYYTCNSNDVLYFKIGKEQYKKKKKIKIN